MSIKNPDWFMLKNYLKGASTVLEICPSKGYSPYDDKTSDTEKLALDWRLVGKDFGKAATAIIGKTGIIAHTKAHSLYAPSRWGKKLNLKIDKITIKLPVSSEFPVLPELKRKRHIIVINKRSKEPFKSER